MENERPDPEMPALREVQQVIARLRESLGDLNRLVEARDATIKDLRGELVLRIEELSQARADLANTRCLLDAEAERPAPVANGSSLHARLQAEALRFPAGNPRRRYLMEMADEARRLERDSERASLAQEPEGARRDLVRAYAELKKLPSPAEYTQERHENNLQQDDLRKKLAHAQVCNAGLRRDVEGHLAALSRIAVKLDVPAQGQWQPIEERLSVLCDLVGVTPTARGGDLLPSVQRLVKRESVLEKQLVDAGREMAAEHASLVDAKQKVGELVDRKARLEQENKLLAERLGTAYRLEMDARRELADARILLDIAPRQARRLPVEAKE